SAETAFRRHRFPNTPSRSRPLGARTSWPAIGPLVEFSQPILAERGDPVTGQEKDADLGLGLLERDHGPLALRLVGCAFGTSAPPLPCFCSACHRLLLFTTFSIRPLIFQGNHPISVYYFSKFPALVAPHTRGPFRTNRTASSF